MEFMYTVLLSKDLSNVGSRSPIHTAMDEAAMQGAHLLIKSN